MESMWKKSTDVFEKNHGNWLNEKFVMPLGSCSCTKYGSIQKPEEIGGRPRKCFEELTDRNKRRRTDDLREERSPEELAFAAKCSYRAAGQNEAANLISKAIDNPTKVTEELTNSRLRKEIVPLTPEEALALIVEAGLSKSQYLLLRSIGKDKNADIFPSYEKILAAKESCYPPKHAIQVSESKAEVRLKDLLDHTARSLLQSREPPIDTSAEQRLVMISKIGCDGSSGYSEYKQTTLDSAHSDSHLFSVTLSPLQIYEKSQDTSKSHRIVYQNPSPSSTLTCRPIQLIWRRESAELIKSVKKDIETQLQGFQCTTVGNATITHEVSFTMVDGKVCNTLTDTKSSQCCYICRASPSIMNDIDHVKSRAVNSDALQFGISPLHANIRCFEYFLHIGYKVEAMAKRQEDDFENKFVCAKGSSKEDKKLVALEKKNYLAEEKERIASRKRVIQAAFWEQMGLHVDKPRPGGFGNSNDGNTARIFFSNPETSASILGLSSNLIYRFSTVLAAISCMSEIDSQDFDKYATVTAKLCVELYGWYTMPPTAHKVLIHGGQIMDALPLPIGQYSEEAQEALHKHIKRMKIYNTRKSSREKANEDLIHGLLISSCPVISALRIRRPVKKDRFETEDFKSLLKVKH